MNNIDKDISRLLGKGDEDKYTNWAYGEGHFMDPPSYSSTHLGAMMVIQVMLDRGWRLRVDMNDAGAHVGFYKGDMIEFSHSEELPMAICLAALATEH